MSSVISNMFAVLDLLEKTSGTKDKEAILMANAVMGELAQFIFMAKDIRFKFNVADIEFEEVSGSVPYESLQEGWLTFRALAMALRSKSITGNQARGDVNRFLSRCSSIERKWYTKCIQKDLASINLSTKSVNAVWENLLLDYDVMLAEPEDKLPKAKWGGWADLKNNGLRGEYFIALDGTLRDPVHGEHYPLGRSGLQFERLDFMNEFILALNLKGWVLDGEFHCNHVLKDAQTVKGFDPNKTEDDFRLKSGKVGSGWKKHQADMERVGPLRDCMKFTVFAMLTEEEWANKKCDITEDQMKERLQTILQPAIDQAGVGHKVDVVESYRVENYEELREVADMFIGRKLEGAVYKWGLGHYEWRRSTNWIKVKEEVETDAVVIGILPADPTYDGNGNLRPTMLGKFVVNDGKRIFEVGTGKGWSIPWKTEVYQSIDKYMYRVMKITAQCFTAKAAINPRFDINDWRDDKKAEDILN